jgi:hypothetical protein
MKTSFLLQAVLGAALALPLALQAQGQRPIIVPDARYPTRPGQGSYLIQEVECLQSTTRTLHQAFVAYCKRFNVAAASPDGQLMRALVDLQLDVSLSHGGVFFPRFAVDGGTGGLCSQHVPLFPGH